ACKVCRPAGQYLVGPAHSPPVGGRDSEGVMRKTIIIGLLLLGVGGAAGWYYIGGESRPAGFRTVQVERGDVATTINATGTIEPEEVIDVGAQIAGQILSFGTDPRNSQSAINYGSPVEQGTVLARIDESLYKAQ